MSSVYVKIQHWHDKTVIIIFNQTYVCLHSSKNGLSQFLKYNIEQERHSEDLYFIFEIVNSEY